MKRLIALAVTLALNIIAYFQPWFTSDGHVYLGYNCTVPFGSLCVAGFIFSIASFRLRGHIRLLNLVAGILILLGVALTMAVSVVFEIFTKVMEGAYTTEYGVGLQAFFSLVLILVGIFQKEKTKR